MKQRISLEQETNRNETKTEYCLYHVTSGPLFFLSYMDFELKINKNKTCFLLQVTKKYQSAYKFYHCFCPLISEQQCT